jgi:hypothetical protein
MPPEHGLPLGHTLPHAPQLFGSLPRSVQAAPHNVWPAPHGAQVLSAPHVPEQHSPLARQGWPWLRHDGEGMKSTPTEPPPAGCRSRKTTVVLPSVTVASTGSDAHMGTELGVTS